MTRILLLITKGDIGGAQTSVFLLASYLKNQGVQVTVGMGPDGDFLQKKLQGASIPTHTFQHLRRTHNLLTNLRCVQEIKKFLTQHPQDIVHCNSSNTLFGAVAAKQLPQQVPTVFTHRGLSLLDPLYTPSRIQRKWNLFFLKKLLRWVDAQVFVSTKNQEQAHAYGIGGKHEAVIYNGLAPQTLTFITKNQARKQLSAYITVDLQQRFVVGSIGRLAYQKNYEFLIKQIAILAPQLPHIACIIIGDGPERKKLEHLIVTHNMQHHIFLTGAIADASQYIQAFDIFTLPSRYEGLSITLIEALFAGVAIVASDVGGNLEVVGDAGLVYPIDDANIFQNQLQRLIADQTQRTSYGKQALARSSLFSINKTGEHYLRLYQEIDT